MRKLFFFSLVVPQFLFAQFTDDFNDQDFINNPTWSGDTANFIVFGLYPLTPTLLRLQAPAVADVSYLSTPSQSIDSASWEFYVEMSFNPSSGNYSKIYLVSNKQDLKNSLDGYFVKVGGSNDEISLFKQDGAAETEIIDGMDGRTNTDPVNVRVKVTRDNSGNWELSSDTTGGNSYSIEGVGFDNTYFASEYFGVSCIYTATRSTSFYFDDFNVTGNPFADTISPDVDTVIVQSSNSISVVFNEVVEKSSSEIILNYSVNNGIGNPSSAIRDATDSSIVHLTFSNTFQNGITNTITATGISDLSGNVLSSASRDFLFFVPDTAVARDVIITEIFPDPDPTVGLPDAEFVEIFNRSGKVFDTDGWTFSDGSATVALGSFALLPGDYLILCSASNAGSFSGFGNTLGTGTLPSLNNTGDDLFLKDNNGLLIDRVTYSETWYRDDVKKAGGWTLERIDENFPCDGEINWTASVNVQGGTPGTVNSVAGAVTDNTPPQVDQFSIIAPDTVRLSFSEATDSVTAVSLSSYAVDNGIGSPVSASLGGTEVTLVFLADFNPGIIYHLIISGVSDCIGNILNDTIEFAVPQPAGRFDVLITEIFASPEPQVALPAAEFVEIFNRSGKTISLENWTYSDASSSVALPAHLLLPDDYLILCHAQNESAYRPFGKVLGLSSFPSLNNDNDELSLKDAEANTVFYVHYSDSWYRDAIKRNGGWSLEMIDTGNPCGGADNWRASDDARGGTPGQHNSVNGTNPDESSPSLNYVIVTDSLNLLLNFSETLDSASAVNIASYSIDNGISIAGVSISDIAFSEVAVQLSTPLQRNVIYTIIVNGVSDCSGNNIGIENTTQFGIPETPDSFDLAVNEILSNPVSGGSDFIELYNRSQKIIDLKDVIIASIDEETADTIAVLISTKGFQLLPGNYAALTDYPENITAQYHTSNPKGVIDVVAMPTFDDDEDIVALFNRLSNNSVIDAVHYYDDWNFALIDDLDGVSLERINYDSPSQDPNNWHSAASTVGYATPAYQNSQFGESASASSTISIDPKIFSPNNDGYEDVLNIRYKLDKPGYVANIKIYDDEGREIRELANNWLLDLEGTITWDGVNDDGEKARIGVYIMMAELFNTSGDKRKFKESCVVAGKL